MATITISDEVLAQLIGRKPFVDAIFGEEIGEGYVDLVLNYGLYCMVKDVLSKQDKETLIQHFQQIGTAFPDKVYPFMANTFLFGQKGLEEERREMGFRSPDSMEQAQ